MSRIDYASTAERVLRPGQRLQAGEVGVDYDSKVITYESPADREDFRLWAEGAWEEHCRCSFNSYWSGDVLVMEGGDDE